MDDHIIIFYADYLCLSQASSSRCESVYNIVLGMIRKICTLRTDGRTRNCWGDGRRTVRGLRERTNEQTSGWPGPRATAL